MRSIVKPKVLAPPGESKGRIWSWTFGLRAIVARCSS